MLWNSLDSLPPELAEGEMNVGRPRQLKRGRKNGRIENDRTFESATILPSRSIISESLYPTPEA